MKQTDLAPAIMSKVARYERDRIHRFRQYLRAILVIAGGIMAVSLGVVVWQLYHMQAFDLLTLVQEDRRIIDEFWQDTLLVFWEQVPPEWFWGSVLCLVSIGAILCITKKHRATNKKKLSQISRYS